MTDADSTKAEQALQEAIDKAEELTPEDIAAIEADAKLNTFDLRLGRFPDGTTRPFCDLPPQED